ncbi:MAG: hypothetical protein JST26_13510 [Bacteroidetes bacterium]|nr:hypothetical protein [Bacteroidota bacterium]
MTFWHRLRFYLIGFVPGCIILFFIVSKKGCTGPNELKMQELTYQKFEFSNKALCKVKCLGYTPEGFRIALKAYQVNYDLSDVHKKPCGSYYLQAIKKDSARFEVIVNDCDTTSKITDIKLLDPKLSCKCDSL